MKIKFVSPVGEIGGAEQVMLQLLACLRPEHEVSVVLMSGGPLEERIRALDVPCDILPLPKAWEEVGESQESKQSLLHLAAVAPLRGWGLYSYVNRLSAYLRREPSGILHTNGIKAHLVTALARPKSAKLVWHIHDYVGRRPIARRALRLLSRRADLGLGVSRSVVADLQMTLPRLPVVCVPNAVDELRFFPGPSPQNFLESQAGLPPSPALRIGLVATYARWKGHRLFLDAFCKAAAANGPDPLRGFIVGGPIYRTGGSQVSATELRRWIGEAGMSSQIGLVPFQLETMNAYRALDVVVHASTSPEPFGLTIAEAMACGRAVVVADSGGASEIVTHEHDGLLYEAGNVDALAAAMSRLSRDRDLRHRLSTEATKTIRRRFSPAIAQQLLVEAYRKVLAPPYR